MNKMLNILILLCILSFGHYDLVANKKGNYIKMHVPALKGPVWNPLQQKPYSRYNVNV